MYLVEQSRSKCVDIGRSWYMNLRVLVLTPVEIYLPSRLIKIQIKRVDIGRSWYMNLRVLVLTPVEIYLPSRLIKIQILMPPGRHT